MKKYENMETEDLIKVIEEKNKTINSLNGKNHYLIGQLEYYKKKYLESKSNKC